MATGWTLTLIGMGSVFAFLILLMWVILASSFLIRAYERRHSPLNKVALALAVALKKRG